MLESVQLASHRTTTGAGARGARAGSRHVLEADEGRAVHASILFAPEHGAFIVPGKSRAWGIYCTLKIAPGHGALIVPCNSDLRSTGFLNSPLCVKMRRMASQSRTGSVKLSPTNS